MALRVFALLALTLALLLNGCAGYQLGGAKPQQLGAINSLHVAMARNDTQIPRAAAHTTNSIVNALTRDGTYRIATIDTADARLLTTFRKINYRQARSTRIDILRSEELEMEVHLHWILVDARNPLKILAQGKSRGTTRFFVDPNLQTARQTALIDALKRASEAVASRLADGF
ncbi:MAG: hypothetical protein ABGZ49_03305 [Akkermansiaceae bacterium]|jgi:hypothetical protein|nr:LPS assembly lipoprotein LptE [Roseibacillus sp.]